MTVSTFFIILISLLGVWARSIPDTGGQVEDLEANDQNGNRLVFAHFMVGSSFGFQMGR